MNIKIDSLNKTILKCKKCPRLVNFVKKISTEKRKQNINETYWGKPVTGFGEIDAKILIIGLAPAAHGGTRTGRAFTGDKSGDFLFQCLFKAKISNQPNFKEVSPDTKAKKGDLVSLDYKATVDGKDFKGSEGKNTQLTLGKDLFLKG